MSVNKRVTLRDIAARLGVSHVTVSLALRNHPDISRARCEEVQKLAKEMGYRPDPALASLMAYRRGRSNAAISSSIAWINHWANPDELRRYKEFDAYWRGASETAERFGYNLDELIWSQDYTPERFEKILHTRNIRGILIPPHPSQPDWGTFPWENFSVIRFGLSVRDPDSHVVTSDQMRMVILAIRKICDLGYSRIGFVMPKDFDTQLGSSLSGGFYAAQCMLDLKVKIPPLLTPSEVIEKSPDKAAKEFEAWYLKHRPDAILTTSSQTPDFARKMGLSIPGDVAMAGTSTTDIPLSAGINQNSFEIGCTAVEILVSLINNNERGLPAVPRRILVEGTWQDGDSLPPRPQALP